MTAARSVAAIAIVAVSLVACSDGAQNGDDGQGEPAPSSEGVTTTVRSIVTTAPGSGGSGSTASGTPEGIPAFVFGVDETVRFDAGGTSAALADAVVRGERNRYTLGASAGQTMILTIVSEEDNAVFDVYGPDESVLAAEVTSASIELPSDGAYTIIVGGTRGNASYELTVEIPAG